MAEKNPTFHTNYDSDDENQQMKKLSYELHSIDEDVTYNYVISEDKRDNSNSNDKSLSSSQRNYNYGLRQLLKNSDYDNRSTQDIPSTSCRKSIASKFCDMISKIFTR